MAASLRELDEVAIAMLCDPAIRDKVSKAGQVPDRLVNLYIKAINDCLAGAPRYRIVGIHIFAAFSEDAIFRREATSRRALLQAR